MVEKRSSWIRTIIILMIGGILITSLGVAGFWFFNQFFRAPEIQIIQPTAPQIVNIGEGILLASHAKSANGIDRVEFHINGEVKGHLEPEIRNSKEMVAQFPWMPDSEGVFNLEVLAYSQNNQASEKASIPIAVVSPDLTPEDVSQLEEDLMQNPMINVAVSVADSGAGISDNLEDGQQNLNGGGQDGQENDGQDRNEVLHIHWDPVFEPPELHVNPPEITSLDVDLEILADRVNVVTSATAVDDEGMQQILIRVYKPGINDPVARHSSMCDGGETCEFRNSLDYSEGDYILVALAVDISGHYSEIVSKNFQVPSLEDAEEHDFELVDDPEFEIPVDFLDGINLHILGEEEDISSQRPYISFFNVERDQGTEVVVWANAEDDNGISTFYVSVFNQADSSLVAILSSLCQGSLLCDIDDQLALNDGSYVLIAQAADIDNNESEAVVRTIQVISNHPEGEPPSMLVGRYTHLIPPEAIPHFNRDENGVFQLPSNPLDLGRNPAQEEWDGAIPENIECIGECEGNTLDYIEVDIRYQPKAGNMDAQIVIAVRVPPGIPVPEGPEPFIKIYTRRNALTNTYTILPLSSSVVEHGAYKESRINASSLCGSIGFYMDLLIGEVYGPFEGLEQIHIGEFDLLQCTPPEPRLLKLDAFSTYGNQIGHIYIEWTNIPQPDPAFAIPIDHFLLTKRVFLPTGVVSDTISVGFPNDLHADYDVLPDTVYEYSIQVVGINGFSGNSRNYLNIRTPPEGANYNVITTDWQPNR